MTAVLSFLFYALISVFFVREVGLPEKGIPESGPAKRSGRMRCILMVLAVAVLYALYNVYCTQTSVQMGGDRTVYTAQFDGTPGASIGLEAVFAVVRFFSGNIYAVFYLTTFFYVAVCVFAFIRSGLHSRYALAFFVLTDAVFFSFTALKQIYACAFATILFLVAQKKTNVPRFLICCCMLVLACLFHNAAIILIPSYFLFLLAKKKNLPAGAVYTVIALLILSVLFVDKIAILISDLITPIAPDIGKKIYGYFATEVHEAGSAFTFIKGLSFYLILFLGMIKRKKLHDRIEHYDALLLMAAMGAALYLSSLQAYWMYRATAFYFFPISVFFGQLVIHLKRSRSALPADAEQHDGADSSVSLAPAGSGKVLMRVRQNLILRGQQLWAQLHSVDFLLCCGVYLSQFVVLFRWLVLIYVNYGGF